MNEGIRGVFCILAVAKIRFANGGHRDKGGADKKKGEVIVATLVGKFIDSYCTHCRLTLAHVVLFEVNGVVSGVKCRTCGSEHRHHGPAPVKKKEIPEIRRIGGRLAPVLKPVRPEANRLWELKNAALGQDVAVWDYGMTELYEKGDVIAHPHFGRGFVESTTMDKMEVLFREGRKLLAMNRPVTARE